MEGLAAQQEQQAKHRSKAGGGRAGFRGVPTNLEGAGGEALKSKPLKGLSRLGVWVRGLDFFVLVFSGFSFGLAL